jgi:hypothetical protein
MRHIILTAAVAFALAAPAHAISAVTSAGALGATDFIDWGQLGTNFTVVNSPAAVTSNGGDSATVSTAGGVFERRDQFTGWAGNFLPNEALLWTRLVGPDITITFANAVSGAGTQWQSNVFNGFGANLKAYDSANTLLGTVTRDGFSDFSNNGSAIFLGVLSSSANISKIVLTLDYTSTGSRVGDFAINRVLFVGGGVVPEPATWAMLITGFGLVGAAVRRRRTVEAA